MGTRILSFISIICIFLCTSCTSTRKIAYFENAQDTTYSKQTLGFVEAPLQKNDFISIAVSSLNADASAIFNPKSIETDKNAGSEKTIESNAKGEQFVGYLINSDGYIEMPVLGKIMAAGITKKQLKEKITTEILTRKLLVDPLVEIRFLNFEVTILGEVATPSVINVPSEKISLVKALAMAGDLTIHGKRENVLLIREEDGVRKTRHIDLNSSNFLNSEYYYLKPNDVIYVEPSKAKVTASGWGMQVLPLAITTVSFLFLVLDRVIK
jgi:polysaccharide biosynthesis/export protein